MLRTLIATILLAVSCAAGAQSLTPAQITTLRAYVTTTPALATAVQTGNDAAIAAHLNEVAAPDFWVWRTSVTLDEYLSKISPDGTSFSYSGTGGLISRSQGELVSFIVMFLNPSQATNPSLANVRAAFADIFSGAGAQAVNNRTHMASTSRRKAAVAEKLLATGTGSTASPAIMTFEGSVSVQDASSLR